MTLFTITARDANSRARTGILHLHGCEIETPAFMPVGTRGTVKAMLPEEVSDIGYKLILGNTFHLHLRPGSELIERLGGLHKFMNWPHAILTDSGGFQVYSLADMRKISEDGAEFSSPYDGAKIMMRPEDSIAIQHRLGSDIVMAFDECLDFDAPAEAVRASVDMTLRWLERCKRAHAPRQDTSHLFGIVQGHFNPELRDYSARRTAEIDLPGYAIGGLSVGEPEPLMMSMLEAAIGPLPEDRPRYAMGIGLPLNLIDMVARGVDMFDCVVPTRNARNGRVFTFEGVRSMKQAQYAEDDTPLEAGCPCEACRHYSRAYLRHLYTCNEILSSRLLTGHNLTFFWRLMDRIRQAVRASTLPQLRAEIAKVYLQAEEG
ncbi:MAG: tRNA guanosine(34) transglycosylase Tgt [Candidatus Sumerlaeia bacterium]